MYVVPEWLPGSLLAGLDWRIPAVLSSLPHSSGTRLKIGNIRRFHSWYCDIMYQKVYREAPNLVVSNIFIHFHMLSLTYS